jgi:hypothetical protein
MEYFDSSPFNMFVMVLNYISNIGDDLFIKCPNPVETKKWSLSKSGNK